MPIKIVSKKKTKKDPFIADKTESLDKEFSKSVSNANKKAMKNIKKKPVIKKSIGKMLETFSPAYSIMKGKGLTAEMLGMAKPKPMAGPLTKEQREAQAQQQIMANRKGTSNRMTPMTGMMAGGPVKRKRSIDGCAMKGKTRAK